MESSELGCIVCAKTFPRAERELYVPLKRFENNCVCKECLRREKAGWKLPLSVLPKG